MKKLWYILVALLPGVMITALIFITSQIYQFIESMKYFANGGDENLFYDYMVNLLQGDTVLVITIIGQVLAGLIATLILVNKMKAGDIYKRPLNALKRFNGLAILISFVGLELFTSFALMVVFALFPSALDAYASMISTSGLAGFTVISTVATIVVAPICEEIIFRGFTMKILEKTGFKFWVVNLIQAALFGIYHLNLVQGLYAFALGFVLGLAYKKCNTIWASILGHAIYNFSGTYLIMWISGFLTDSFASIIIPLLIGIALAACGITMLLKLTKNGNTQTENTQAE